MSGLFPTPSPGSYTTGTPAWTPAAPAAPAPPAPAAWTLDLPLAPALSQEAWLPTQPAAPVAQSSLLTWSQTPIGAYSLSSDLQDFFASAWNFLSGLSAWTPAPAPQPSQPSSPSQPRKTTEFVISSFNVLGSSHTKPGGNSRIKTPGPERMPGVVRLLAKHKVEVVGFQEFQGDQEKAFKKLAGGKYALYPDGALGKGADVNSIAWDKTKWEMVKPGSIKIPYFEGHEIKMPVVRLRNKATGQEAYFANFHNPASTANHHDQERFRDEATRRQIDLVNKLKRETGLPVFITGDMNEREEYFEKMTAGAPMVASNGGSRTKAPSQLGIDWIFGSKGVKFSGHTKDKSPVEQKTSDHPMIVSKARIEAGS